MSLIRSVLLHLDNTSAAAPRLAFARGLALRHEAALSALFVALSAQRPVQLALAESPAALLQPVLEADSERARSLFERAVTHGGPAMRWLDGGDGDPADAFSRQALYADLLVLGQHDPGAALAGSAPAGFVESVILGSGKPALILPHSGHFETIGRDVLIGWNATPQAARAVGAALPWLREARRVHVLEAVDEPRHAGGGGLDIGQYLQFHGIVPALHRHRALADAGDVMLSLASDVDADLLVMGCYGHSRARELVLGGASRTVLQTMTLPVLMAH
jgi:nucleotide-binding universal stress UspA family protein